MTATALTITKPRDLSGTVLTAREIGRDYKFQHSLAREETIRQLAGKTLDMLNNPFMHLVVGFTAVEILQKFPSKENPVMPQTAGNILETAGVVSAFLENSGGLSGITGALGSLIKLFVK